MRFDSLVRGAYRPAKMIAILVAAGASCFSPPPYTCIEDSACASLGPESRCALDDKRLTPGDTNPGRCTEQDGTCPSGLRARVSLSESSCVACGSAHQRCCSQSVCQSDLTCATDQTCSCVREILMSDMLCALRTRGDVWCSDREDASNRRAFSPFWQGERVVGMAAGPSRPATDGSRGKASLLLTTEGGAVVRTFRDEPPERVDMPPFAALMQDGAQTWGATVTGDLFELANGKPVFHPVRDVVQLTLHGARTRAGEVWSWRAFDRSGITRRAAVARLPSLEPAAELMANGDHICARKEDGSIWCLGDNVTGGLGTSTRSFWSDTAVAVDIIRDAVHLSRNIECARRADGSTWCWGPAYGLAESPTTITWGTAGPFPQVARPFRTTMPTGADLLLGAGGVTVCGLTLGRWGCLLGDSAPLAFGNEPFLPQRLAIMDLPCD